MQKLDYLRESHLAGTSSAYLDFLGKKMAQNEPNILPHLSTNSVTVGEKSTVGAPLVTPSKPISYHSIFDYVA